MIETKVHDRRGQAVTNFARTMSTDRALLAIPAFKDPYILDFVALADDAHERHLERALIDRVQTLLMKLGERLRLHW